MLQILTTRDWNASYPDSTQQLAIKSIESGQILYFPELAFTLSPDEIFFLTPEFADPQAKNMSYAPDQQKLWGVRYLTDPQRMQLKQLMSRFSLAARGLIQAVLPRYATQMITGRTSLRPVQVCDRKTSYRKDDKRLHVDAFPSAPNQGKRILRVFANVNPAGEDRVWRVGEPFKNVAERFLPQIKQPSPVAASLLRLFKITKSYRTAYDHYMLYLHDRMKADEQYQQQANQQEIRFPAGSSWIVLTDEVSHAAMHGQHVFEQTFYVPVSAMLDESRSPLRVLEHLLQRPLV